ncbi:gephyrin-like molybdotransferase Glp [Caldalkalibacillus salinus]|uniref:molybdopterin molybdotransferase MoeA n=1 Tax=Caldalkalibacillus salinus TaxID=2803787 RepID=UPI0019209CD4|nr:gephyrin-like molybdotransferase Glp [Caldalkalibacillus salinus]
MVEQRIPIPVEEAITRVKNRTKRNPIESVPLEMADGRVLAEDLIADHPIPSFDRSAFDGFAIRAEDTAQASFENPITLKVVDDIGAGAVSDKTLGEKEAIRIMTGAQIPSGTTAILALELSETFENTGETWVRVNRPVARNSHISRQGEDTDQGEIIARKGRRITAGEMSMLATFGYAQVNVYRQPVVGIYATGTELLPVDAPLTPGKIRNSNSYMLQSQVRALGAIPKYYGILPDDYDLCLQKVRDTLEEVDFLMTTGGASVGDFDYVQDIMRELDAHVLFNKVSMRPGSVTTVSTVGDKWLFGLSGNPAACYVGFELFARPVLKTALGSEELELPRSKAVLAHDLKKPNRFTRFVRAKASYNGSQVTVQSVGLDKSGVASALVEANVLLIVPPNQEGYKAGEELDVMWLDR